MNSRPATAAEARAELARRELARRHLADFVTRTSSPDYVLTPNHRDLCRRLQRFVEQSRARKSPRLIVVIPPQRGKSHISTQRATVWAMGAWPGVRIGVAGYSQDIANYHSMRAKQIAESVEARTVFPRLGEAQDDKPVRAFDTPAIDTQDEWTAGGSAFIGVGLGVLIGRFRWLEQTLNPFIVATQVVPKVAFVPLFVGGDSAGGNLATVVTRKLHEAGTARIAGNLLAYPNVDRPDAPSLHRFAAPFLGIREIGFFLGLYLPDAASAAHPDFAPLHADNLGLLPPTFILTAEHDLITEQAEAYGARLAAEGVKVRTSRHAGMIHGFLTLDPFLPGAGMAGIREFAGFIADHL